MKGYSSSDSKKCSQCKEFKPLTEFHKNKTRKDGLQTMCKDCNKENSKKQYGKDRRKRIEYVTNWQEDNPENRREYRRKHEKSRRYKEYKREYMREYMKNYQLKEGYREHRRQYMKEYYQRKKREAEVVSGVSSRP